VVFEVPFLAKGLVSVSSKWFKKHRGGGRRLPNAKGCLTIKKKKRETKGGGERQGIRKKFAKKKHSSD